VQGPSAYVATATWSSRNATPYVTEGKPKSRATPRYHEPITHPRKGTGVRSACNEWLCASPAVEVHDAAAHLGDEPRMLSCSPRRPVIPHPLGYPSRSHTANRTPHHRRTGDGAFEVRPWAIPYTVALASHHSFPVNWSDTGPQSPGSMLCVAEHCQHNFEVRSCFVDGTNLDLAICNQCLGACLPESRKTSGWLPGTPSWRVIDDAATSSPGHSAPPRLRS
jgi:hypothetical protein